MNVQERRSYDPEFKKNAALLCDKRDQGVVGMPKNLVKYKNRPYH